MVNFIIACVMNALLTTFIVSLGHKLKIKETSLIELVQARGNKLFSEMFRCGFCLCFWIGMVLGLIACIATGDVSLLSMSFFSTPLALKFLRW